MASIVAGSRKPKSMGSPQQIIATADLQPLSSNLKVPLFREVLFTFCFLRDVLSSQTSKMIKVKSTRAICAAPL